jgi:hypothetical protein
MRTFITRGCVLIPLFMLLTLACAEAQEVQTVTLPPPVKTGGMPVLDALSIRASVRSWAGTDLSMQDLSDLLWAANGINRPDKRRTASSAQNAQDVDLYVFLKDGVYLYDAAAHALTVIVPGDHRSEIGMARGPRPPAAPGGAPAGAQPGPPPGPPPTPGLPAPVTLVLVSDVSRFGGGTPELRLEWGALDAGIVSQNIALFCAARHLGTRPRAGINKEGLKVLLKLKDSQHPFLEHPVGHLVAPK